MEKVRECGKKIPYERAPGLDGILDFKVKQLASTKPKVVTAVFNHCLREELFPEEWKTVKLVLIWKGDKLLDQPSSYKHIYLLDSSGKMFERVIKVRLEAHFDSVGGLYERQFGFRRERSTVDVIFKVMEVVNVVSSGSLRKRELCRLIVIDVANAFNSVRWSAIEGALVRLQVSGYLLQVLREYLNTSPFTIWR